MSKSTDHDQSIAEKIHRLRFDAPSPLLHERVMRAARTAWAATDTAPSDISWRLPVLRFAASLACALTLVSFVHITGGHHTPPWRTTMRAPMLTVAATSAWVAPEGYTARSALALVASLSQRDTAEDLAHYIRERTKMLNTIDGQSG
jgi:hypothetical protein